MSVVLVNLVLCAIRLITMPGRIADHKQVPFPALLTLVNHQSVDRFFITMRDPTNYYQGRHRKQGSLWTRLTIEALSPRFVDSRGLLQILLALLR